MRVLLQVPWWIIKVLEVVEIEPIEHAQSSHLSGECQDVWVVTQVEGV